MDGVKVDLHECCYNYFNEEAKNMKLKKKGSNTNNDDERGKHYTSRTAPTVSAIGS